MTVTELKELLEMHMDIGDGDKYVMMRFDDSATGVTIWRPVGYMLVEPHFDGGRLLLRSHEEDES